MKVRLVNRAVALVVATTGLVALGAAPVEGHEGRGVLVVENAEPDGGLSVRYTVRLTWENDAHPARDATVTAAAVADDGTPQTPVQLEPVDEDGRYTAVVAFPAVGVWTVRFTSVTPTAVTELVEQVGAPSPPTVTSSAPTSSSTTPPPTTASIPAPSGSDGLPADQNTDAGSSSNDGRNWIYAGSALAGVAGGVVAVFVRVRGRRR